MAYTTLKMVYEEFDQLEGQILLQKHHAKLLDILRRQP